MTQAKPKFRSFEEYLSYSNDHTEQDNVRYELIDGDLVELAPESGVNNLIARRLLFALVSSGITLELVVIHACEIQVPQLKRYDALNRYPDLVVLRSEHLQLTQRRLTITREMPPPRLVVEIVSPGKISRERDYITKRAQYAAIGVVEYWIIDPIAGTVLMLELSGDHYREVGVFQDGDPIVSPELGALNLTVKQILSVSA